MQFIQNGPNIPERLLQLHEDGQLIFFCGAGISMGAELPSFKGLVDALYEELRPNPSDTQSAALKARQYDTAIYLLENDVVGGRITVRNEVYKQLKPAHQRPTKLHQALLVLGRNSDGQTRLVTTNFDHLFEYDSNSSLNICEAPLLHMPNSSWDSLWATSRCTK
jgi:NAD-dependent SIR2 family protein deacetylase